MGIENIVIEKRNGSAFLGHYVHDGVVYYFVQIHPFVFITPDRKRIEWISDFDKKVWKWKLRKNVNIKREERGYVINLNFKTFPEINDSLLFVPLLDIERAFEKKPSRIIRHGPIVYFAETNTARYFIRQNGRRKYEVITVDKKSGKVDKKERYF